MIVYLEGEIIVKKPTSIVLKVGGVGYEVNLSLISAARLSKGDKIELKITQIIKEDSHKLYGFLSDAEQEIFEALIKVNGIGASSALALLSSMDINSIVAAICNEDTKALCKAPGIGAKTAGRLILELKEKMMKFTFAANCEQNLAHFEAAAALASLGFKKESIDKTLKTLEADSTAELIKKALKKLS